MPSFSRGLEKALHQAMNLARERAHEFATLEHLLLALTDDRDTIAVLDRLRRRCRSAEERPRGFHQRRARQPRRAQWAGRAADRRVPARDPARRDPRPVLGQGRGHRRQRARRDLRRAREPCRLFPRAAGHDAGSTRSTSSRTASPSPAPTEPRNVRGAAKARAATIRARRAARAAAAAVVGARRFLRRPQRRRPRPARSIR